MKIKHTPLILLTLLLLLSPITILPVTSQSPSSEPAPQEQFAQLGQAYDNLLELPAVEGGQVGMIREQSVAESADLAHLAHLSIAPLKIGITSDGLYQLTHSDLTNAGLDLSSVDPRTIKISHRGIEQPIIVMGEQDGVFDANDTVHFYGTAITDDIYTAENIYWLTVDGVDGVDDQNGQRMSTQDGTLSGNATVPTHFPTTLHAETNSYYWQTMPNGEGQDHWFWDGRLTAPDSRLMTVTLDYLSVITATAPSAVLRVSLKGGTQSNTTPDHHSKLYLNESLVDEAEWDDLAIYEHSAQIGMMLQEGDNVIRIENVSDSETDESQLFVNWLEIDYWRRYVAQNDQLIFAAPQAGTFQFEVSGFSSPEIELFDITEPTNPVRLINTNVVKQGSYTLQVEHTAQADTRYLALTAAQQPSPNRIELDQPSAWKSETHGADYIIITYGDFYSNTLPLAEHRRASGLRVATVKVEDIYDEFNDGIFNPSAIRDFLSYAYHNWTAPAPTYVLLVGDAVQDYKDNAGRGSINYVPSQIVYTNLLGQTPSDNWFVTVSGDDILPDMSIGRLSAQNSQQVDDIVQKIINYEENPPTSTKNALFVADNELDFESTSEELADLLPADYSTSQINASEYTPEEAKAEIIQAINNGYDLVNYTGHGSVSRWSNIFNVLDVEQLNNSAKLPVITTANCLNGFFTGYQNRASLAETLLRQPEHGAVAVWAPANLYYTSAHRVLIGEFYNALQSPNQGTLGEATTLAKIATYNHNSGWGELIETFILFGDPAMKLGNASADPEAHQLYLPIVITRSGSEQ